MGTRLFYKSSVGIPPGFTYLSVKGGNPPLISGPGYDIDTKHRFGGIYWKENLANDSIGLKTAFANHTIRLPRLEVINNRTSGGIWDKTAIKATSTSSYGVYGLSTSSIGVYGASTSNNGIYGTTSATSGDVAGVYGLSTNKTGVWGKSTSSPGVRGESTNSNGLYGQSTKSSGVFGYSSATSGDMAGVEGGSYSRYGVWGKSNSSTGVYGTSTSGSGVYGKSTSNYGIYGESTSNIGIYGKSTSSYGVRGFSASGYGMYGSSTSSIGVYGKSTSNYGVYGQSSSSIGVYGYSTSGTGGRFKSTSGNAIYAQSSKKKSTLYVENLFPSTTTTEFTNGGYAAIFKVNTVGYNHRYSVRRYANKNSTSWESALSDEPVPIAVYIKGALISTQNIISDRAFVLSSDIRIKKDIETSDSEEDLALLKKIRIRNYKYIDSIKKGNRLQKKVIAQELDEVYPIAVTKQWGDVNDVYQGTDSLEYLGDGRLKLFYDGDQIEKGGRINLDITLYDNEHSMSDTIGYTSMDRDRSIVEDAGEGYAIIDLNTASEMNASGDLSDKDLIERLEQGVIKDKGIYVFIKGRYVKDLHTVDYDTISMLNVSATQALASEVDSLRLMVYILSALIVSLVVLVVILLASRVFKK